MYRIPADSDEKEVPQEAWRRDQDNKTRAAEVGSSRVSLEDQA